MSDSEPNALSIATDLISSVPAPIQHAFWKTLGRLLGGAMAIPAAKFKQVAQGIEDTTAAKSSLSASLTQVVAKSVANDPLVIQAAAEVLLPDSIRKVKNRLFVAQSAAEHLSSEALQGATGENASSPSDDWMNNFMRNAEDASSARLQDLFGRILAGEIMRPGAFHPKTLRAVTDLDQQTATEFMYAWSKCVDGAIDYSPEWQRGESFSLWKRLAEAGLMSDSTTARFMPDFKSILGEFGCWIPMSVDSTYICIWHKESYSTQWSKIDFTQVGKEVGSLLDKPNYKENMRQAVRRMEKTHAARFELYSPDEPFEVVWMDASAGDPRG